VVDLLIHADANVAYFFISSSHKNFVCTYDIDTGFHTTSCRMMVNICKSNKALL